MDSAEQFKKDKMPKRIPFRISELLLMPLVVALVGFFGTKFITKSQIESSEKIAATQLSASEKRSREEKQLKLLEIYSDKITSKDINERMLAVRLLGMLDPTLSTQLATIIAEDINQNSNVRNAANSVIEKASKQNAFVVIKSTSDLQEAISFAKKTKADIPAYNTEVFLAENGLFAVTLGSYLNKSEADSILNIIKKTESMKDSFVKQSNLMGENILK